MQSRFGAAVYGRLPRTILRCAAIASGLLLLPETARAAQGCSLAPDGIDSGRVVEIDPTNGPLLGRFQYEDTVPLKYKEIAFTFDDGPDPVNTPLVLDALDAHCVKATFFPVGRKATLYADITKDTALRGHTIGAHTWSHPPNLARLKFKRAILEIERGFSAVRAAAGREIAPFFRYPGLNDSRALNAYAAKKNYAVLSCDITSDDWIGIKAKEIVRRTLRRIEKRRRGIILMHDRKPETAKALPMLLDALAKRGYRVVHLVPKEPEQIDARSDDPIKSAMP